MCTADTRSLKSSWLVEDAKTFVYKWQSEFCIMLIIRLHDGVGSIPCILKNY